MKRRKIAPTYNTLRRTTRYRARVYQIIEECKQRDLEVDRAKMQSMVVGRDVQDVKLEEH